MSDANPFKSPHTASHQEPAAHDAEAAQHSTEAGRIARYAQPGLRLLGVMFIVDGIGGVVWGLTYGKMQASAMRPAGYAAELDPYAIATAVQSVAYIAIGLYCVIGGRWVLEMVFLPSASPREAETDVSESLEERKRCPACSSSRRRRR